MIKHLAAFFSFSAFQGAMLGIVQGLGEFLPISSSAQLILVRWALGWEEFVGGPVIEKIFDVILHAGTFLAVVGYFWGDLKSFWHAFFGPKKDPAKQKIVGMLAVSTIPGGIFGVLFEHAAEVTFSRPHSTAIFLISLGVILVIAERVSKKTRSLEQITWTDALLLGIAQAFAVLPGISRSGITMTAALFLGVTRESSARYSFLMSIPIIGGAILWEGHKLLKLHLPFAALLPFGWGFVTSAMVGYLTIRYFLRYISRGSFYPFALYRLIVGGSVLLALALHLRPAP